METRRFTFTLKHLGMWSTAKFGCFFGMVIYSLIGAGVFVAISPTFATAFYSLKAAQSVAAVIPACLGLLIGAVLVGGFFGFIHFAIMAFLFNIAAFLAGGIKMEFERQVRTVQAKSKFEEDEPLERQLVEVGQHVRDLSESWKHPPRPDPRVK